MATIIEFAADRDEEGRAVARSANVTGMKFAADGIKTIFKIALKTQSHRTADGLSHVRLADLTVHSRVRSAAEYAAEVADVAGGVCARTNLGSMTEEIHVMQYGIGKNTQGRADAFVTDTDVEDRTVMLIYEGNFVGILPFEEFMLLSEKANPKTERAAKY